MRNPPFKPLVPDVNYRSGIIYAFSRVVKYFELGISTSKKSFKQAFGKSPFIHGRETLERYVGIMNNFRDTILIPSGIKTIAKIKDHHISLHFENLIRKRCSEKTIAINASALSKLFEALGRKDLVTHIEVMRPLWKERAVHYSRTEPFANPERVINTMRSPFKEAATIQYLTGARASDIKKVYEWILENPDAEEVVIRKSKGGRNRTIRLLDRPANLERIKHAVSDLRKHIGLSPNWDAFMKGYTSEVRRAAKRCGEIYTGTHAFRVSYASERFSSLSGGNPDTMSDGKEKAVLKTITEELGHSRISMAKYYITIYRK